MAKMNRDIYTKVCMALPSLLLAMCLSMLAVVVVPEIRQIEKNTNLQTEKFGERLTKVEKQYGVTLNKVRTTEERIRDMEFRLTLLSIIPPTQAMRLETTADWKRLVEIIKESQ